MREETSRRFGASWEENEGAGVGVYTERLERATEDFEGNRSYVVNSIYFPKPSSWGAAALLVYRLVLFLAAVAWLLVVAAGFYVIFGGGIVFK